MRFDLPVSNQYYKGRGAQLNPTNPFSLEVRSTAAAVQYEGDDDEIEIKTKVIETFPKTIVNKVDSPDIGLEYSLNPYQGCEHGCVYCYARNTHPYWGYSAGVEFETVIMAKKNAPELLDALLSNKRWKPVPIMLSGNTDCYQPVEKELEITRALLNVFLKHKHPVGIITKNALILRDLDILQKLNQLNLVNIAISINTIDDELRRLMEPRTSSISKRFELVKKLTEAGLPVTVMASPIIPGLNDMHILPLAKKTAEAGARSLAHSVVRLNGDVQEIFDDWLGKTFSDRKEKVLNKIKSLHNGKLGSYTFKDRMQGSGKIADIIHQQFKMAKKIYCLNAPSFEYNLSAFKMKQGSQLSLF